MAEVGMKSPWRVCSVQILRPIFSKIQSLPDDANVANTVKILSTIVQYVSSDIPPLSTGVMSEFV